MPFSSLFYLPVLAIIAIITAGLPQGRLRLGFVALASLMLAYSFGWTITALLMVTFLTFLGGIAISKLQEGSRRAISFFIFLCLIFIPLLYFKYSGVIYGSFESANLNAEPVQNSLILPVGISFYTFMAAGYLIDTFVGKMPAERRPITFVAFMSFFPYFAAGPIGRAPHLVPQLEFIGDFKYENVVSGLRSIIVGLFMKVVIADSLAPYVSKVYSDVTIFSSVDQVLATIYFSFQVYCDFAGYSLVAIGSAKLFNIDIVRNFEQPYLSQSLPEYWRRWHISLSSWFRDYVFIPLQFRFRRSGSFGLVLALIFTFTLVGIWHGAGPQYAVFGMVHGALVAFSTLTLARRTRFWLGIGIPASLLWALRALLTFLIVSLTFVLFRADSLSDAFFVYGKMGELGFENRSLPLTFPLLAILIVICGDVFVHNGYSLERMPTILRWIAYYVMCIAIFCFSVYHLQQVSPFSEQFIYFKF